MTIKDKKQDPDNKSNWLCELMFADKEGNVLTEDPTCWRLYNVNGSQVMGDPSLRSSMKGIRISESPDETRDYTYRFLHKHEKKSDADA